MASERRSNGEGATRRVEADVLAVRQWMALWRRYEGRVREFGGREHASGHGPVRRDVEMPESKA